MFIVSLFLFVFIIPSICFGGLPASAKKTFKVLNIFQDNDDTRIVGALPCNVLRYEFFINRILNPERIYQEISKLSVGEKMFILSKMLSDVSGLIERSGKLNIYDIKGVGKDLWKGADAQDLSIVKEIHGNKREGLQMLAHNQERNPVYERR